MIRSPLSTSPVASEQVDRRVQVAILEVELSQVASPDGRSTARPAASAMST